MNQTRQVSSSLVHGVPDAWMEQTRQLANAFIVLAPNAATNQVVKHEARQLANMLLQSANDLASRYRDIDSSVFARGLRARLCARLEKCPELYPFIEGTVTWMLAQVEEYPCLAVLLIYASILLLIGLFSYFFISPTLEDEDKNELSDIIRRASLSCSGEVIVHRGAFPALEAYLSPSALIFSSRLFIPLLWTCTERNPVPQLTLETTRPAIPLRRRPCLTEFVTRHYLEENANRYSGDESTDNLWPAPLRIRNRPPPHLSPPHTQPFDAKKCSRFPSGITRTKKGNDKQETSNNKKGKKQKKPIRRRRSSLWENSGLERLKPEPPSASILKRFSKLKAFLKPRKGPAASSSDPRSKKDKNPAERSVTAYQAPPPSPKTIVPSEKSHKKRSRLPSWWKGLHDGSRKRQGMSIPSRRETKMEEQDKSTEEEKIEAMRNWTWKTSSPGMNDRWN